MSARRSSMPRANSSASAASSVSSPRRPTASCRPTFRFCAASPMLDDEALARIHYIIGRNPGLRPEADVKELESEIRAAIRNWDDGFSDAVQLEYGETTSSLALRYANAFPAGYRDHFTPEE